MAKSVEDRVRDLVGKILAVDPSNVDLDMPIEEVADSLELSGMFVAAEREFGVELGDSLIGRIRVVRDLVTFVQQALGAGG